MQGMICVAAICVSAFCVPPVFAEQLSNDDVRDMFHTRGFCMGQTLSLDEIGRKFPSLAAAAEIAKLEFSGAFGPAVTAMSKKLEDIGSAKWDEAKQPMSTFPNDKLNFAYVTEAQTKEFVTTVRQRAEGQIEERTLQTLLMWNPTHRAHPESEFVRYKRKCVTNVEGKSKGIKWQIEYPVSWASLEAERPNIVRKFVSERGRGSEYALVIVKALAPADRLTKREIDQAFSATAIREFVPPGATFISGKRISFDSLPGGMITFSLAADRMGQQFKMRSLCYMTFFRDKVVMLQFSTTDDDATFTRFEPLFRVMANSTVILSRYE